MEETKQRILDIKRKMGSDLLILGHYYQRDEVIEFADHQGDSFALAEIGSKSKAKWIVFCGVYFMAEASSILARDDQRIFLPNMDAGCPLADMASIEKVEEAWGELEKKGVAKDYLPVVYMNSSADLKAFCGEKGGTVCTSSSASKAFEWVISQGKKIFFFPDENLGRNTAHSLGVEQDVVLWKGYCHVHTFFTLKNVKNARAKYPDCKVIVHPECDPQVVVASDAAGSTAFLKKYAEDAPSGETIIIGTEINLVSRLARIHPGKKILPLARSLCPNMFKTSAKDLLLTLEGLPNVNEILVDEAIKSRAKLALDRMLRL